MRTIGILGGMGPAATVDLMAKLITADPAAREQDRIRMIVDCDPTVLDRNAAVRGEGPSPGPDLAAMARGLVANGAQLLIIACNTAHAWSGDITAAVDAPLLSMIETACDAMADALPEVRRVGLLAGQGCLDACVYQDAFAARGWKAVMPTAESQAALMEAIYRVKSGVLGEAEKAAFLACAYEVIAAGAQAVMAGCTELPLLLDPANLSVPMIDPALALARRAVAYARR